MSVVDADPAVTRLADLVRAALGAADLDAFAELLDPEVTWGAPGDPAPACQNRKQVLDWYKRGRADGRRAHVTEVLTNADKILVGMQVTTSRSPDRDLVADRWQVLTVRAGRIADIRGFEALGPARAAAGLTR
jgi:ketosteroid isomerase-like protein